jgi:Ca2+-binding RTX toxin-like protein
MANGQVTITVYGTQGLRYYGYVECPNGGSAHISGAGGYGVDDDFSGIVTVSASITYSGKYGFTNAALYSFEEGGWFSDPAFSAKTWFGVSDPFFSFSLSGSLSELDDDFDIDDVTFPGTIEVGRCFVPPDLDPDPYKGLPSSPLVIDLDGDGVELISLDASQAFFDLGTDGYRERTGWVDADDGLLVWDRDQDGKIENGSEVFGDQTGHADGFAALAELDSNGDGVVNAADDDFVNLQIWRDLDGDGYTDDGELFSLDTYSVVGIDLGANRISEFNEGNEVRLRSTVQLADGGTAAIDDVWFETDTTHSLTVLPDDFQVADGALDLPDLGGYGQIASAWMAYSMNPELMALGFELLDLIETGSFDQFREQFDEFVLTWAGVEDADYGHFEGRLTSYGGDVRHLAFVERAYGQETTRSSFGPRASAEMERRYDRIVDDIAMRFFAMSSDSIAKIAFKNGEISFEDYLEANLTVGGTDFLSIFETVLEDEPDLAVILLQVHEMIESGAIDVEAAGIALYVVQPAFADSRQQFQLALQAAFAEAGISEQTPLYDFVFPTIDVFDGTTGDDTFSGGFGDDQLNGNDGDDMLRGDGGNDHIRGDAGADTIAGGSGDDTLDGGSGNDTLDGESGNDTLSGNDGDDTIDGGAGNDVAYGNDGADVINGGTGNDTLYGNNGNDVLDGGAGYDLLSGGNNEDVLSGGAGNDRLYGENGHDILDGGAGNDRLNGGYGNDTYRWDAGAGSDVIEAVNDRNAKHNVLELGAGIGVDALSGARSGNDLILSLESGETLTIQRFFDGYRGNAYHEIQEVRFADGTVWGRADLAQLTFGGTGGNDRMDGTGRADTMTGLDGNDTFYGNNGDDVIDGGSGNDTLYGRNDHDTLTGGSGDDRLYGENGHDILDGGAGNDRLNGGYGNDTYRWDAGAGSDVIEAVNDRNAKHNVLELGAGIGVDALSGARSGNDLILSLESGETLTIQRFFDGYRGNAYHEIQEVRFADGTVWGRADLAQLTFGGTGGNDRMDGTGRADTMTGLDGNDTFYGNNGDDVIDGGSGNDTLYGRNDHDTLTGGSGDDRLYGENGHDILDGGAGNDRLNGGYGNDTYRWDAGAGSDVIEAVNDRNAKHNVLELGAGIGVDALSGARSGNDLILSLESGETLTIQRFFDGYRGNAYHEIQEVRFADGTVWGRADLAQLTFGGTGGNDRMDGTGRADTMTGLDGNDTFYGNNGDDVIDGGSGNDTLYGRNDHDTLTGGSGDDRLYGENGHDILDGGAGNDRLNGGYGNDTYRWDAGAGSDVIEAVNDRNAKHNVLELGAGIGVDALSGARSGNDLILSLESGETLTIQRFFDGYRGNAYHEIQEVRFADGTVWGRADLAQLTFGGTGGNDRMDGTGRADTMTGLDGNDTFYGNNGDDVIDGGSGNDTLYGRNDHDTLTGGSGDDRLYGENGHDILDGGAGNDRLNGGYGNDTYRWDAGAGSDVIEAVNDRNAKHNVLELGAGIGVDALSGARSGNDLILSLESGETLTIQRFFDGYRGNAYHEIQEVRFADGTVWGRADLAQLTFGGTGGNDRMDGTGRADTMTGLDGNDTFYGNNGDDVIDGGSGNDTLYGRNDHDTLTGGSGDDRLYGENGHDILDGGAGNDRLNGGYGNDTYRWDAGAGSDVIEAVNDRNAKHNVLELGAGIGVDALSGARSGNDLILSLESGETLTIQRFFDGYRGNAYHEIQEVRFADGTVWGRADLAQLTFGGTGGNDRMDGTGRADTMTGLDGNDTFYGNNGDDVIDGGSGNDTLYGRNDHDTLTGGSGDDRLYGENGHDILDGGAGNDRLNGGYGNDTYRWDAGAGSDVIEAVNDRNAKHNVLELGAGIGVDALSGARSGNDLILSLESGETLTIQRFFDGYRGNAYHEIQEVRFADGTVWGRADLAQLTFGGTGGNDRMDGTGRADTMTGLDGNDTFYGNNGDDVIDGGSGNDTLYGRNDHDTLTGGSGDDRLYGENGHDILDGGAGNDRLNGGYGNDTYRWDAGAGSDVIEAVNDRNAKHNVLELGAGIGVDALSGARSGNDLILSLESGETLTIQRFFDGYRGNAYHEIQEVRFADGTVWGRADLAQLTFGGTGGNDRMDGTGRADTMTGLDGNDTFYGNNGDDVIDGGSGNDTLYGRNDHDTLTGGSGDDRLYGENGHDILDGGAGNDRLNGGYGNDTYRWDAGAGSDVIEAVYDRNAKHNVLELGAGIAAEDLAGQRSGNDLILRLETGETLTVQRFFDSSRYHEVQEVRFADGTAWGREQLTDPAAAVAAMALDAVNLVENGSFELGYDGWTLGGGQLEARYTPGVESSRTSDGASALPLGGWVSTTGQTASQTVVTEAGEDYRLTFDAGVNFGASGQLRIQVADGDTFIFDQVITDDAHDLGLESHSFAFTATSASSTVTFTLDDAAGDIDFDIDNVAIIAREDLVGDTFDWA